MMHWRGKTWAMWRSPLHVEESFIVVSKACENQRPLHQIFPMQRSKLHAMNS